MIPGVYLNICFICDLRLNTQQRQVVTTSVPDLSARHPNLAWKGLGRESLMSHKHPALDHNLPSWNIMFCRIRGMRIPYVNYLESTNQAFFVAYEHSMSATTEELKGRK